MSKKVYIIERDVQYEGSEIEGVWDVEDDARRELEDLLARSRHDEWRRWRNASDGHLITAKAGDIAYVLTEHEVK
jgi:hypothetical protein